MMSSKRSHTQRRLASALRILFLCSVGLLTLYSCSSKQQVLLRGDGSGSVQFRVTVDKILMDAANSLSQGGSSSPPAGEFDIPKIREVFSKNQALKLETLSSPRSGVLDGTFSFKDIGKLFQDNAGGQSSDVVTFSRDGSRKILKVHITRTNFAQIAKLAGMSDNPMYQMFGPEQNAATSVDDLNQMMVYVLGEAGPAALKSSSVDVQLNVEGKVVGQTGGTLNGNTVDFHIPLVRLLLLETPLDFSVTFS